MNVDKKDLLIKIKNCWLSLFEDNVVVYSNDINTQVMNLIVQEIFIDDFRYNIGYRLFTFSKLSDERFNVNNEKYDYTIHKYKRDLNCQLSILEKLYSMKEIKNFIKKSLGYNCHKCKENNFNDLSQLKLNKSVRNQMEALKN